MFHKQAIQILRKTILLTDVSRVSCSIRCIKQNYCTNIHQEARKDETFAERTSISSEENVDFFGFIRNEGVEDVTLLNKDDGDGASVEDCIKIERAKHSEKIYETNFGRVRYDSDHLPTQNTATQSIEDEELETVVSKISLLDNFVSYNNAKNVNNVTPSLGKANYTSPPEQVAETEEISITTIGNVEQKEPNYIDDQYFNVFSNDHLNNSVSVKVNKSFKYETPVINPAHKLLKSDESNVFDDQYFATSSDNERKNTTPTPEATVDKEPSVTEIITKHEQNMMNYKRPNIDNPKTAYDYVKKLRHEKMTKNKDVGVNNENSDEKSKHKFKLDSYGFRIYEDQVEDHGILKKDIILRILKNSVLYNDHEIVALYKPYGLSVQGTRGDNSRLSLVDVLPDLSSILSTKQSPIEKLFTVHRIDRETTGVMVLAKTQFMANLLSGLFKEGKISKEYIGITRGVPDIKAGVIEIPITEGRIEKKARMVLRPDLGSDSNFVSRKNGHNANHASTKYEVLNHNLNAALMAFYPTTGVKHQIRVHTGFGLNCPILGDHKYSDVKKLAPQKLPGDMLDNLKVRQSKVRHMPMHLHSRSIMIPEINDGKNVFIKTKLPYHFIYNMNSLKLKRAR